PRLRGCGDDRNQAAARGGEHGTATEEAAHRQATREAVAPRLPTKRSRATVVRRCAMPKANGPARPRGIPAREDPLGHQACAQLLTAISAQDVLVCSDGSRVGRGALEAVRALPCELPYGR